MPSESDGSPSLVTLCLDSNVNPNIYLDMSVRLGGWG